MRLGQHCDIAAAEAVTGDALAAALHAPAPAAKRRCGRKAARESGVAAQHADPVGQRLGPGDMGELVEEAFGEECRVAVRTRSPMPGRHADIDRVVVHGKGGHAVKGPCARDRIRVTHT